MCSLCGSTPSKGTLASRDSLRFVAFQFSRLDVAGYILDLERGGVSDLNFRYVDFTVRDYLSRPGLQEFIRSVDEGWAVPEE